MCRESSHNLAVENVALVSGRDITRTSPKDAKSGWVKSDFPTPVAKEIDI